MAEYAALRRKIDDFATAVTARRGAELKCRAGCAACCHVELSVSSVEAAAIVAYLKELPASERRVLHDAGKDWAAERATAAGPVPPRCVMLRQDDTCAIYPVRPLVCRSQGLPLLYPRELVPEPAQRGLSADGRALTCCPLNFRAADRPPRREDILDADRVDVLLGVVNRRFAADTGTSALARHTLANLVNVWLENL